MPDEQINAYKPALSAPSEVNTMLNRTKNKHETNTSKNILVIIYVIRPINKGFKLPPRHPDLLTFIFKET